MKNVILFTVLSFSAPLWAQPLETPAPSPAAKVMQRVGLTDVTVEYSSPAVKGRKIWGELVPYDKIWRTGANLATKVTFSRDVTVGGKPVAAGTYSVVTLPAATGWTVILNKELGLFSGGKEYKEAEDVLRVPGTVSEIPARERMTFLFSNTSDSDTSLDLEWEKIRVSVAIHADTTAQTLASIKGAGDNAWRPLANAARWLTENTKEYDQAIKYADQSIALKSTWFNNWVKADALSRKGQWALAKKQAQVAWDLGQKDEGFFLKDTVAKAMVDWKSKK